MKEAILKAQIDVLQRQIGVMGKYNCKLGKKCVFTKKYFELIYKELEIIKAKLPA